MATQKFSNNASALLAIGLGASDLSIQVESGGGAEFPSIGAGEFIRLAIENALGDIEIVHATARAGDIFTVTRAQEGTTARTFVANQARVELRLTKETMERFIQHDAGVVNRDLTIPNLTVSGTFTVTTGVFSNSLTVAGVDVRDASLFNTGTLSDARLSSNIPKLNSSGAFTTNLSTTGTLVATGSLQASRGIFGYDSGVAGSCNASGWFRSDGATGWYNASYGGGINMEDTSFVRTYGAKHFYVGGANIYCSGDITAYYSDERLKTRIGDIENALDKVCTLSGFRYIENELARTLGYKNENVQVGLSAQAVQAIMPEVVELAPADFQVVDGEIVSKSGENYLTVNYARLVPLLIEAIKELTEKVRVLEAKA